MKRARLLIISSLSAAALLAGPGALAAEPCGGLSLQAGVVQIGDHLPVSEGLAQEAGPCLEAIAKELVARPAIRSITVAARVAGDAQARRLGLGVAKTVADTLAAHGIARTRISAVVPTALPGEADGVQIAFVERRSFRPVAQVWGLSGKAWSGARLGALEPAALGAPVTPRQYFETGSNSVAVLMLVDGSRVRVASESVLRIGQVTLDSDRRRSVQIEVLRGDAVVRTSKARGPFRLVTGNAIAGARGTRFRLALADEGVTRLETLEGTVNLAGSRGQVFVASGEGSLVDYSGFPERPRPLLVAPAVVQPVLGERRFGDPLQWRPVPQADRYRVEFARNAEFSDTFWSTETEYIRTLVGEALSPGKWFWRVTAIDRDGFVGLHSKTYAFTVLPR